MAGELTAIWSERAAIRDKKLREQLAARTDRERLESKEQQEKDAEFTAEAVETVLTACEQRLTGLQERADDLDAISLQALIEAQQRLEEILRNANRARDGRAIFEASDGTIYDENGNEVKPADIDPGEWNDDGPSWDDFSAARDDIHRAQALRDRVRDQQDRLADNPDEDALDDIDAELDALEAELRAELGLETVNSPVLTAGSHAENIDPFFNADISMVEAWDAAASGSTDRQIDQPAQDAPGPDTLER